MEAASASIDSLQQLLHVYLLQRASRHETTLSNLESLHHAFLLSSPAASSLTSSDEEGYAWMKGPTQDALVALILTTALADRDFTAHEVILPMMESQHRRRGAGGGRGEAPAKGEGVSGQVVTGLRALTAILCVEDSDLSPSLPSSVKQPAPLLASPPTSSSLHSTLSALRAQLLANSPAPTAPPSFRNDHAGGAVSAGAYLNRLSGIVGVILQQCDEVVGVSEGGEVRSVQAGGDSGDATRTAFCLILRVMTCVWPSSSVPLPTLLSHPHTRRLPSPRTHPHLRSSPPVSLHADAPSHSQRGSADGRHSFHPLPPHDLHGLRC